MVDVGNVRLTPDSGRVITGYSPADSVASTE